jgi:hypothetical protein
MTGEDADAVMQSIMDIARQPTPVNTTLVARCNGAALTAMRDLLISRGVFTLDEWEAALLDALNQEWRDGVWDPAMGPFGYGQPIAASPRLRGRRPR